MRDENETDRLIHHLTEAMALSRDLHRRCVHRLVAMALIDLGQDIAADDAADTKIANIVA